MKDSAGPSHPLPLKPHNTKTSTTTPKKRKLPTDTSPTQTTTPANTARRLNGHSSQDHSPTGSMTSIRSTASRRGDIPVNDFPVRRTEKCEVYVFGAGSMGELGLGAKSKDRNVKRPRLNVHLSAETLGTGKGVVDVAVGGMHVAALDSDGGVWTWGVNDQGSLGRDTKTVATEEEVKMADGDDSDDEEEELLNLAESKPGLVQGFPAGVKVVQLACGDSISVAIADDGLVYSWGTFRVPPLLPPNLRTATNVCCRHQMAF
jgi:alpha-tubulin suppressor-like RCC1 family protein